jgi:hypothetical protein
MKWLRRWLEKTVDLAARECPDCGHEIAFHRCAENGFLNCYAYTGEEVRTPGGVLKYRHTCGCDNSADQIRHYYREKEAV